jgi:tetratricopeptide (TPR) repeat protein
MNSYCNLTAHLGIAQIDLRIGGGAKDAYQNLRKAKNLFSNHNSAGTILHYSAVEGEIELREENFDLARVKFQECLDLGWGTEHEIVERVLERFADIRAWPTDNWQERWPVIYCGHAYKSKAKLAFHKALLFLGDVFVAKKDEETATNLYMVALEGFNHMDVHYSRAQCMMRLGDCAEQQGHTSGVIAHWKAARPLFEQSLQAKDVAQIDARLSAVEKTHQESFLELVNLDAPSHLVNAETSKIEEVEELVNHQNSKEKPLAI